MPLTGDGSGSGELSSGGDKESPDHEVVTVKPQDEDKCDPNPCKNGGTCVRNFNYIDGYQCQCADDYGGLSCGGR